MRLSVEGSEARRCEAVDGSQLFIIENEPLERLLFDRNSIGLPFMITCRDACEMFLRHIVDDLEGNRHVAQLLVLSKGLAYQVGAAYEAVVQNSLPVNLIATRRSEIHGASDVEIAVPYARFDAGGDILLIGDTVASGATLVAALTAYAERHTVGAVYILSFAGALVGANRVIEFCARQNIRVLLLFGLAAFGLASNGFDLSFLHPDTVTADRYRLRATEQFSGKAVSAVGWDFGSQGMAPTKYQQLCWMEAERWGMHGHPAFRLEERPMDPRLLENEAPAFLQ